MEEPFKMTEICFKKGLDKSNARRGVGREARDKILICTTGMAGGLQFFVLPRNTSETFKKKGGCISSIA